jgi:subtilisin-like proprotein convertase family protein
MNKKLLLFAVLVIINHTYAQEKLWEKTSIDASRISNKKNTEIGTSTIYRLDFDHFKNLLLATGSKKAITATISIPNSLGKMDNYLIWESSNFAPELQAQFPQIRAYAGYDIKDPSHTIRISLDPTGIKTMTLGDNMQTEFIEPVTKDGLFYQIIESNSKNQGELPFKCSTREDTQLSNNLLENKILSNTKSFKTFRLALSCTAEYAIYHGGTVAGALGGMNATLTRVNGIFDRDLAVKVELIPNNASIIYLDPVTDPYSDADIGTDDDNPTWNLELQNNLTATIGNAGYDIGHLFGASGGGGNAGCIGCVCINPSSSTSNGKGSGFTSPSDFKPEGDTFDVDYVAHEMGHQLGANHTFSFAIEGTGVNVEPGSGSTIMGYAGITNYNVQNNSDPYFHYRSILQIQNNLAGKTCPVSTPLSNTPPTVSAGADYTIPKGTPFILTGTGNDVETNNQLTYTWEQNNNANNSVTGASSIAFPTKPVGPNFRSVAPGTSPVRYFPALKTVLKDLLTTTYESVSTVSRTLNFVLTARDNDIGKGQTNSDATVITVNAAIGPFDVTSQNTDGISWIQGTTQTVTWAVNNTTILPGSSNVDILLSTDGGLTFPIVLKNATPNDGTEDITVPNVAAPYCRIMVKPTNHIYYDINSKPFAIGYTVTNICNTYTITPGTAIVGNSASPSYSVVGSITVPAGDNVVITDLNVSLNITHPQINDLYIGLIKPGSSVVDRVLYQRNCPVGIANMNTTFDDSGTALNCATITGANTYQPLNTLDIFNGVGSAGTWRLAIADVTTANSGTLNSLALTICSTSETLITLNTESFGLTNFNIYPNPNNGSFNVAFDSDSDNEIKIAIYDISGRQIFNQSYHNTGLFSENLKLNHLQSGISLVNVQDGNKKEVKKIIVN